MRKTIVVIMAVLFVFSAMGAYAAETARNEPLAKP